MDGKQYVNKYYMTQSSTCLVEKLLTSIYEMIPFKIILYAVISCCAENWQINIFINHFNLFIKRGCYVLDSNYFFF